MITVFWMELVNDFRHAINSIRLLLAKLLWDDGDFACASGASGALWTTSFAFNIRRNPAPGGWSIVWWNCLKTWWITWWITVNQFKFDKLDPIWLLYDPTVQHDPISQLAWIIYIEMYWIASGSSWIIHQKLGHLQPFTRSLRSPSEATASPDDAGQQESRRGGVSRTLPRPHPGDGWYIWVSPKNLKIGPKWFKKGFKSIRVPPLEGNFGGEWWFWMILTMGIKLCA